MKVVYETITHHGVEGQKWGVRNGPPYPLKNNTSTTDKSPNDTVGKMRDNSHFKKLMKQTALDAGKVAIAFSSWSRLLTPVALSVSAMQLINYTVKTHTNNKYAEERASAPIDKQTGLKLKTKNLTEKEDLKRVNPARLVNASGTDTNCMNATSVVELRKRGYDVAAKPGPGGIANNDDSIYSSISQAFDISHSDIKNIATQSAIDNNHRVRITDSETKSVTEHLTKELSKQGSGARGNIIVEWAYNFGGHSLAYEVTDNGFKLLDGQSGKIYNDPSSVIKETNGYIRYCRLDDKKIKKTVGGIVE